MSKPIDLHIHSDFSEDADLSVDEIFRLASDLNISAISITDHDSLGSIPVARSISHEFRVEYIPGVELTTVFSVDGSQQHVLGYFVDENDAELGSVLEKIHHYRFGIARKRIEALKRINFELRDERIWELTAQRPPTATSIMLEVFNNEKNAGDMRLKDYFYGNKSENRLSNFYREFLSEKGAAYVPFESISLDEGIDIIQRAGGIAVLAHPIFIKRREWLDEIVDYGIEGIEAITTYHEKEDTLFFLDFAKRKNLLITAGSDFHGPTSKPKVKLGGIEGNDYTYLPLLKKHSTKNK
jgi:predicted metal-dependent phosphoesterase TrpH